MKRGILLAILFILALAAAGWAKEGTVTLPLEDYNALLKRVPIIKPTPAPPPVDYCLSQAAYSLTCRRDYTVLNLDLRLHLYKKQWMSIPLLNGSFTVKSAKLDGEEVSLVNADGFLRLIIRQEGVHDLSITCYLDSIFKDRQLTLPLLPATMSTLNLELIPPVFEVSLSSGLITALKQLPERTALEAVLKPEESLTITVKEQPVAGGTKPAGGKKQKPRIFAEYFHLATLGEALMSVETKLDLSILNAPVTETRIAIPQDLDILDVRGDSLNEWAVLDEKGGKYLRCRFKGPVQAQQTLTISSEKKLKDVSATSSFPYFHLVGADREKGCIGICARTNVEIKALKTEKVVPIDVQELPPQLQSGGEHPLLLAFKYLDSDYQLTLEVKRYEDVAVLTAVADSASAMTLVTPDGKSVTRFQLVVKNNLKQFLSVILPSGAQLWSTFVASASVKPGKDKDGRIIIPLQKSGYAEGQISAFPVEIVYFKPSGGCNFLGMPKFSLPQVDLPVTQVSWSFYLPENNHYFHFSGMDQVRSNPPLAGHIPLVGNFMRARSQGQMSAKEESNVALQAPNVGSSAPMEDKEFRQDMGETLAKGVLPVMVTIPEKGKVFCFQKLIVDKASSVRIYYMAGWFYRFLTFCFFLGGCFLMDAWLKKKLSLPDKRRRIIHAVGGALLLIFIYFYFIKFLWAACLGVICTWLYSKLRRMIEGRMNVTPVDSQ